MAVSGLGGFESFWVVLFGCGWFRLVSSGFKGLSLVVGGFEWFWVISSGFE